MLNQKTILSTNLPGILIPLLPSVVEKRLISLILLRSKWKQHSFQTDVINDSKTVLNTSGGTQTSYNISSSLTAVNSSKVFARYLSTITWEGGTIEFDFSQNREDIISGGQRLDNIIIKDYNDELIRSYHFEYDYFGWGVQPKDKALRLISLVETGADGTKKPPYVFQYVPGTFPSADSKSVDHFGFFNGANNNTRIPTFTRYTTASVSGANREPGNATSAVGMLREINYPTGGSTKFNYEAHHLENLESFRSGSVAPPLEKNEAVVAVAQKCNADGTIGDDGKLGLTCATLDTSPEITVRSDAYTLRYQVSTWVDQGPNMPSIPDGTNDLVVKLYEKTASGNVLLKIHKGISNETDINIIEHGKTYFVEATSNIIGAQISGRVSYKWMDTSGSTLSGEGHYTGGIRIASVENKDRDGSTINKKIYKYLKENMSVSSGISLAAPPVYNSSELIVAGDSEGDGKTYTTSHTAYPTGLLGVLNGSHVIYTTVKEIEEGNGYTQYQYSYVPDGLVSAGSNGASYSKNPRNSRFWKRGHLLNKKVYSEDDSLIQETVNNYSYEELDESVSFGYELASDNDVNYPDRYQYGHAFYKQTSGWAKLNYSEQIDHTGNSEKKVTTTYTYGLSNTFLPTSIVNTYDHDRSKTETLEYLNNTTSHVISPIKTRTLTNSTGQLQSKTHITYSSFKPTSVKEYDKNNAVSSTMTLSDFNGIKPSYVQHTDGSKAVYLWAYNSTLPVVKAENIDYTTLLAAVVGATGTSDLNAFWENYKSPDFNKTNWASFNSTLRNNSSLSGAFVSTYTYDPLIGMTSQTDPNGMISYYEYDEHGRLEYVKDENQDIVSKQSYHYAFNPELYLSESSLNFSESSDNATISVTSNTAWSVSISSSTPNGWVSISTPNGTYGNAVILIDYSDNPAITNRSAVITVTAHETTKNINLTQDAAPPALSLSTGSVSRSYTQGNHTINVSSNLN